MPFKLLEEYHVLAGQQESGRQKIVLLWLSTVSLAIQGSFEFF